MTGTLCGRLRKLCAEARRFGDPVLSDLVAAVDHELVEPLRVAVAGRVNAGKSTLVNALLGQRIAPTSQIDCTKVVTWYRYGTDEHVDVHAGSGAVVRHELTAERGIPEDLGLPVEQIDHLVVTIAAVVLSSMTLIDTPGLGSLDPHSSGRARALLGLDAGSVEAASRAEAVIFVFTSEVHQDERDVLLDIASAVPGHDPVNAIGVLSKADMISNEPDPWPDAQRRAASFATSLSREVIGVIPAAMLLAETVSTGALREADATAVNKIAAMPSDGRNRMLRSVERFRDRATAIAPPERRNLLDLLDLYGVRLAIEAVDSGVIGAIALGAALREHSGWDELNGVITTTFARRGDVIKARSALRKLEALAYDRRLSSAARSWVGDTTEAVRFEPEMHALAELEAANDLSTGVARLPARLDGPFRALLDGHGHRERLQAPPRTPARELAELARKLSGSFKEFAYDAAPRDAHVAHVAHRSYQLMIEQLDPNERHPR